jgi:predicted transcriptional regulator
MSFVGDPVESETVDEKIRRIETEKARLTQRYRQTLATEPLPAAGSVRELSDEDREIARQYHELEARLKAAHEECRSQRSPNRPAE